MVQSAAVASEIKKWVVPSNSVIVVLRFASVVTLSTTTFVFRF